MAQKTVFNLKRANYKRLFITTKRSLHTQTDCQISKSEQKQGADDGKWNISRDSLTLYHDRRDQGADSNNSHPVRPETPDWSQNYNINLTQPLYQGGRIQAKIHQAELKKQIAALTSADNEAEIKLVLLQQYMTLFSYYKQREVLARNIEESEHRLKDIRRMKKEGIVTRNDEIRSELQLTNDRLTYQEADNSISIASQQLDILLGLDESQLIAPDTTLLYTAVSVSDYDTYVQLAYNNYPGMQIVRQQTLLAENDIRPD